jgi:hypothetical protein
MVVRAEEIRQEKYSKVQEASDEQEAASLVGTLEPQIDSYLKDNAILADGRMIGASFNIRTDSENRIKCSNMNVYDRVIEKLEAKYRSAGWKVTFYSVMNNGEGLHFEPRIN